MTTKMVDSILSPEIACPRGELLQFAERFEEWTMIKKEFDESTDPRTLDLNSSLKNARTNGLTSEERRQILKVIALSDR